MTDDEYIQSVVDEAQQEHPGHPQIQVQFLVMLMKDGGGFSYTVARHLLSRDPECVRVPMKGKVG